MKNLFKVFGIVALAVVIGCFMAGCGDADGGPTGHTHTYSTEWSYDATQHWHECTAGDGAKSEVANHTPGEWIIDTPATETTDGSRHRECSVCGYVETEAIPATGGGGYLISGTFASQTGTGDAVFYADYTSNARFNRTLSVSRAVGGMGSTEKELTGKIEDGDIIFNLKGVYDTDTEEFLLSAGSSVLIYQLVGTLSSTGEMSDTSAAVKVKDGTEWVTHEIAVTASEDVEISGNADATQQEGLPSAWFGLWEPTNSMGAKIVTAFQLYDPLYPDSSYDQIVDIVPITPGEKYETVWESYGIQWNQEAQAYDKAYIKVVMESDGANLNYYYYFDSVSVNFDDAKAYNTADDENPTPNTFKRP